jgi:hypothetical protein
MTISKFFNLGQRGATHYLVPVLIIAVVSLAGVRVIQNSHALTPKSAGSCSITGVPSQVPNGAGVTPTIVVNNAAKKAFTTTVSVDQQLVSPAGAKGGGSQTTVTVPGYGSVQFKGGTLTPQVGYTVQIKATSSNPAFTCSTSAQVALGDCSITGVPATVASGLGVTPTVVVNNFASTPYTTTMSVDEIMTTPTGGSKGGGSQTDVSVPANSSVQVKGGTLYGQTGYVMRFTATSSSNPSFSCTATTKVI